MKKILITIIISVAAILGFAGCAKEKKEKAPYSSENPVQIVATTGMIGDIAQSIGGPRVQVYTMMGPGIDPHLYKAKAGDVERLGTADLILYNGLHLESKMGEILERLEATQHVKAVTDDIPRDELLQADEGVYDPHVWFDVLKWRKVAETILNTLIEVDPQGQQAYGNRYTYVDQLIFELDQYVRDQTARIPAEQRILVTAHDAFGYFGSAYGFEVHGLQGINTVDEAGISDMRALADFITENRIPAVFVESSVSSKSIQALQAAVQDRGFDVKIGGELYSDAMGSAGTEEGTYVGMVRHNIETIVSSLTEGGH